MDKMEDIMMPIKDPIINYMLKPLIIKQINVKLLLN